jgi:hypothetical protein
MGVCWVFNYWQIRCQNLIGLFKKEKSQVRKNIAVYSSRKGSAKKERILQNIFQEKEKAEW